METKTTQCSTLVVHEEKRYIKNKFVEEVGKNGEKEERIYIKRRKMSITLV